jgi:hypothetical protein
MARLWGDEGLDLNMVTYDVMETGFETGYIEFVDKSACISAMHLNSGFYQGSFKKSSIMNYFNQHIIHDKSNKFGW